MKSGKNLDGKTIRLIRSIGLLDKNEQIIFYYSNFEKSKAGNFITDKRLAHYWLAAENKEENDTTYAYYSDILAIDTTYFVGVTYSPFMNIKRKDGSEFKVYIEGKHEEMKVFFEEAIRRWQQQQ